MALIKEKIIQLLQYRIQQEQQSSRIYKAMSSWLNLNGFLGAAKLWQEYSDEELDHAEWTVKFLLDLNILPVTPSQEEPELNYTGLSQIIALSMKHELDITNQCEFLAKACLESNDFKTFGLAQKYVDEQVGEIAKVQTWVDRLESFGTSDIAIRMLDKEMGE